MAPTDDDRPSADAHADQLRYRIRRSDRARRVRVSVDARGEVEVVLPRRTPERAAAAAVVELRPWIERRIAATGAARAAIAARAGRVPYLGRELRLRPQPGRTTVQRDGDELLVPADEPAAARAIEAWYRRAARAEIEPRLIHAAAQLGVAYGTLTIRNQRTRWGSCSAAGALSFNWRLLLAPAAVLDYVVWHEACHLRVMDHSPRFWALLREHVPGYDEQRRWLRREGATLHL